MTLPGDAAAASVRADRSTWIVGARPGRAADAVAARHGARRAGAGAYVVARGRARSLARALRARGLLLYAEPNRLSRRMQVPAPDPLDARAAWRAAIVDPRLVPPPVTPLSPMLALVDSQLDQAHPEFPGGNVSTLGGAPLDTAHGTETAAVAAAPKNDVGILGVWPGMRAINVPLPEQISCIDSVTRHLARDRAGRRRDQHELRVDRAVLRRVRQLQLATAKGITLVAAAGNELGEGNPLLFPASLPHVLTVAAVGSDVKAPYFSNATAAVDLAAPGVGILTATPPQFDGDGEADGYEAVTGTSFSAPMVAAAAAWLRAAKPGLKVDQVAQTLRGSARDLGGRGWDSATGFGMLSLIGALGPRPRRPIRTSPTTTWPGSTAARSGAPTARSGAAGGRSGCAHSSTSSRTRPTSTAALPAARAGAGDPQAASATRTSLPSPAARPRPPTTSRSSAARGATAAAPTRSRCATRRGASAPPSSSPTSTRRSARSTPATTSASAASSNGEREVALGVGRGQRRERLARLVEAVAALDRHAQAARLEQQAELVEG